MSNFIKIVCAFLLAIGITSKTFAEEVGNKIFLGLIYTGLTYSEDGSPDFEPSALSGRIGILSPSGFGVEFRNGAGLTNDVQNIGGSNITLEVVSMSGIYASWSREFGKSVRGYFILGYDEVEMTASVSSLVSVTTINKGKSFGFGLNLGSEDNNSALTLEYMNYINATNVGLSGISLGYTVYY